ncbi:MAG: 3-hydroxyacyl-CoA dehydrogenase family protein [Acidimicrobiia bacterium]
MTVKRVGIVGSGIMGSGIAEVAAKAGFEVSLRSRQQSSADKMMAGLEKSLGKQVDKGKLDAAERDAVVGRVRAVTDLGELAECDLVIESIVEDLAVKKHLFNELDRVCHDAAVLATNTSTLPVVEMAMESRPDRVCGIHFFNPAPMMPLVEVVHCITTSDETVDTARAFAESCGKSPVLVRDQAGFIVNALLFPYLNNAVKLLDAGVASRDDIDAAMKGGCNFPMGPLELLDLVGLDTSLAIIEALYAEFRDPNYAPAPLLRRMVSAERLGRKSRHGFYDYG